MASLPIFTVIEHSQVLPPPATIDDRSLQLTFFDIAWLPDAPVHSLFFYEYPLTQSQFSESIVPDLKRSLSITLQHFFPFVGNLIVFPATARNPEIRYVKGDSVSLTVAECALDFNDLTGNHPRDCDKFYHLIPPLGHAEKASDYLTIPVFSIQVTFFPDRGISVGMTNHHCLGDANTRFCFLNAWASTARSGTDESFLANGTSPLYDRVIKHDPALDELYLKKVKVETIVEGYQIPSLARPSDKVRATFVLTGDTINRMKKWLSTQFPSLQYISSFIAVCAYVWCSMAKVRNDKLQLFGFMVDCRGRLVPPIPANYFGNCGATCFAVAEKSLLTEKEGFFNAARLLGDNLHKMLNDKDGIMNDAKNWFTISLEEMPTIITAVAGTPKLQFYDIDFGWGRPRKHETISIDYSGSISLNSCKESKQDLEIGMCLSATEMEAFIPIFNGGLDVFT